MKKYYIILMYLLVITLLLIGCESKNNEDIDIPTISQTLENDHEISVIEYEDSYEGKLQYIIDYLHRISEDIDNLADSGINTEEHKIIKNLVDNAIGNREIKYEHETIVIENDLKLNTYMLDSYIIDFFNQYPDETSKETNIVEFMKYICYWFQKYHMDSDLIYENEKFYNMLFPNTDKPEKTINEDGSINIFFKDYQGKLAIHRGNRNIRFDQIGNADVKVYENNAVINFGYYGNISVAPLNEYGAVGKTSILYIENTSGVSLADLAFIMGESVYIGKNSSTEEINAVIQNFKETKNSENYLTFLKGHPSLVTLLINYCGLQDINKLVDVITEEGIQYLDLSFNDLLGTVDFSGFTNIISLSLPINHNLEEIILPENCSSLMDLNIAETKIKNLDFLTNVKKISQLWIEKTNITSLSQLAGKEIKTLSFTIEGMDYSAISEISGLKQLYLHANKIEIDEEFLQMVKEIKTLETIYCNDGTIKIK